jgi:hypothetical protein
MIVMVMEIVPLFVGRDKTESLVVKTVNDSLNGLG